MSRPEEKNSHPPQPDLTEAIAQIETQLERLKQRYQQVITAQERKEELLARKKEIESQIKENRRESLKSELYYLQKELEEIEVRLESQLFKWSSLSEPFWQAVRFLGLGIVIGWILKSLAGN
ncbi:MAG: hypothetical protein NZ901_08745 [Geminocystis sp.]|nr:hypothetical protein [Geminocystis sp.]HIK37308.1 hypothetical protein [Geminocystis sp. M7585_C2015_104]MCS7148263.1 hypothetical protein [Geminocystis sp.]MCX8077678.1 hypothetical protein [Geminocystis sp.]MDW8116570.1 hypothetical protein [Geminocystis sp.]